MMASTRRPGNDGSVRPRKSEEVGLRERDSRLPAIKDDVIQWLMEGDPAIRWQVGRDLLDWNSERVLLERAKVAEEGWGAGLLELQDPSGKWANGLYSPKWTSTTYTLLLLRHLGLVPGHPAAVRGVGLLLDLIDERGEILFAGGGTVSDVCVNGMVLSLGALFVPEDSRLDVMVSRLIEIQMSDGGWNCKIPSEHSSVHTTISVLEGLLEYEMAGGRLGTESARARTGGEEFFRQHQLYKSRRTGEPIHKSFTMLSFPPRWHFDILRGLDYLREARVTVDPAFGAAIEVLESKRSSDGTWPVQNFHSGRVYFHMEKTGGSSRWNTLRALRVLRWWDSAY